MSGYYSMWRTRWDRRPRVCTAYLCLWSGQYWTSQSVCWDQDERTPLAYPHVHTDKAMVAEHLKPWRSLPALGHQNPLYQIWLLKLAKHLSDYKLELHYNNMMREDSLVLSRSWKLLIHIGCPSSRLVDMPTVIFGTTFSVPFWQSFSFLLNLPLPHPVPPNPSEYYRCLCSVTVLVIRLSHMDLSHVVVPSGPWWSFLCPHTFITPWPNSGPYSFRSSYSHIYLLPGGCRSSPYFFTAHLI